MAGPRAIPYPLTSNDVALSKLQCRVVATSNIVLSGTQTIDGVAVVATDRVFVAGQTAGVDNGIYVCAAGAWSRSDDFSVSIQVKAGLLVVVTEGTLYADTLWILTTNDPITLGATALAFARVPSVLNLFAIGNTTQNSSTSLDARSLSFNGLGIVTVGFSNGSIQVSATAAAATQSNQTVGLFAVGNTTQASSTTLDARTISLNGLGAATVGFSNGSVQVSVPVQTNQSVGLFAVGNTTGQSSSSTVDARSLSFDGAGIASVGMSGGSVVVSVPSPAAQTNQTVGFYAVGNTTQNSSTTLDARTVSFDGLGGATVGFSNGSVQVSAPAVSSLQGTGGIVVTTTGSTISVSGWNITNFEPYPPTTSTTNYPNAIGTWYLEPFYLPANMSGGRLNRIMSFGSTAQILRASSADFQTGTTGTRAVTFNYANTAALYSLGAGTNSTQLTSLWSNTFGVTIQSSCSVSSAVNILRITCGATMSIITSIDSAGSYTTSTVGSTTSFSTTATSIGSTNATQYVSSMVNMLSGSIIMPVGLNSTLAPGNYWLGQAWSTSSTTSGTSGDVWSYNSQFGLSIPIIETANSLRQWLQTASTTNSQFYPGHGVYSAAVSSPPATIAFSDVRSFASGIRQYFNFVNSTLS